MRKNIIVLITFIIVTFSVVIVSKENELEKLNEQVEMRELYYEAKLDYYEERYGVDLDDTPEDFMKFIYDNYRELYDYLVEVDNDNTWNNFN